MKYCILHNEFFAIIVENIISTYGIPSRLCEHSKLVRFEKCAAKTLQHGQIYGDIIMLHNMTNTCRRTQERKLAHTG